MDDDKMGLLSAAEDILSSVDARDPEGLMHALYSFFEMCDAAPHEEGEHLSHGGPVDADDHLSRGMDGLSDQHRQSRKFGER